jgi:predicted flap endonuclease-1-like 5' DNA nuclease
MRSAAERRGPLGGSAGVPGLGQVLGANGAAVVERNKAEAVDRLASLSDRLRALKGAGLSVRSIAATLNGEGVSSPGGAAWHPANVQRALGRLGLTGGTPGAS